MSDALQELQSSWLGAAPSTSFVFLFCRCILQTRWLRTLCFSHLRRGPLLSFALLPLRISMGRHLSNHAIRTRHPAGLSSTINSQSGPVFVSIPRWVVTILHRLDFVAVNPPFPYIMLRVTRAENQTFTFYHQQSEQQFCIYVGRCPSGLWVNFEFIDCTTGRSVLVDMIADAGGNSKNISGPLPHVCTPLSHVAHWDSTAPQHDGGEYAPELDGAGLRWTHHRTFAAPGRTVSLRMVKCVVARGQPVNGSMWVIGIKAVLPWDTQKLPLEGEGALTGPSPPNLAPRTTSTTHAPTSSQRRSLPSRLLAPFFPSGKRGAAA